MVHQQKQYEFYNHNLSSLFQYLCITLVIKKLYEFEISTLDDLLILFIKLNTNWGMDVIQKRLSCKVHRMRLGCHPEEVFL